MDISTNKAILKEIDNIIKNNDIVLFMKGTKHAPMCGFSATVTKILQLLNIDFLDINVLSSSELREGIKEYTNWPTIPQLYIKGEFIGGCDIVKEMYENNELRELLSSHNLI